ncbi:hypothetical protein ACLF3G_15350 [Falsiroseomonas sp. HC035]|uniref:hypothetical protein n=1 Tax=Falsiroseomonas sp. HC035 TaxID=3390999 RepID=UPI003D312DA9
MARRDGAAGPAQQVARLAARFAFNTGLAGLETSGTNSNDVLFGGLGGERLAGSGPASRTPRLR